MRILFTSMIFIAAVLGGALAGYSGLISKLMGQHQSLSPPMPDSNSDIAALAEKVRQSAIGTLHGDLNYPANYPYARRFTEGDLETLMTIEALNLTNLLISTPRRAYHLAHLPDTFQEPGGDVDLCLDLGYGLCGNHVAIFIELLGVLGIERRPVQFYYIVDDFRYSHIAVEVFLDGHWRFFDPHYGRFWVNIEGDHFDLATYEALKASLSEFQELSIETSLWNLANQGLEAKEYFLRHDVTTIRSEGGLVDISGGYIGNGVVSLEHLPSYVGDNTDDGHDGIAYDLDLGDGFHDVRFDVESVAGCNEASRFCVGGQCSAIDPAGMSFEMSKKAKVEIKSERAICYVVLDEITFNSLN